MTQLNKQDIIHPITIILDDPTSYHLWSQNMTIFLKGGKLLRYVTSLIPKLVPIPRSKATTDADVSKTSSM